MSVLESAAARIVFPLSAVIQRPLMVATDAVSEAANAFIARSVSPRLGIVATDGKPFSGSERQLLNEIFELMRMAHESDARFSELEQRMLGLQRENLDLIVKNRTLNEVTARDPLTGLYSRWYVLEKIESEINRSLRHGSPMAVLMLDIDHFKRVNDSFGHPAGDQVLQSVGKVLRESCRVYDVPGRYGGEEFCVVLPETRLGNTTVVAERIRQRLATTEMPVAGQSVTVTASIGIAGVDNDAEEAVLSPAALIDRADRALYSAKHRGRNRVEMWDGAMVMTPPEALTH